MRGEWLAAVTAHVNRLEEQWEPSCTLDPGVLNAARQLSQAIGDDDLDAWYALGMFHMQRWLALEDDHDADDRKAMTGAVAVCLEAVEAATADEQALPGRLLILGNALIAGYPHVIGT